MATDNLGNVTALIRSVTPPVKTYVLWGQILDPSFPNVVKLHYYLNGAWTPLAGGGATSSQFWLDPVTDEVTSAPANPANGGRYIVAPGATGTFAGKSGRIATYNGTGWSYAVAPDSAAVIISNSGRLRLYKNGTWTNLANNGYGPYTDVAAAAASIALSYRYPGLTVGIQPNTNAPVVEYWWAGPSLANADLSAKLTAFKPVPKDYWASNHPPRLLNTQIEVNDYFAGLFGQLINTITPSAGPGITGFAPASGTSGTTVVITGTNFSGATVVSINSGAVGSFTVDSPTQITAVVSSTQTTGKIRVLVPNKSAAVSGSDFTVTTSTGTGTGTPTPTTYSSTYTPTAADITAKCGSNGGTGNPVTRTASTQAAADTAAKNDAIAGIVCTVVVSYDNQLQGGGALKDISFGADGADLLEYNNASGANNAPVVMELWIGGAQVAQIAYAAYYDGLPFRYKFGFSGTKYTKNFTAGRVDL